MRTPTFRKQGSTKIINCESASRNGKIDLTYEGEYKTPTTIEESKYTVQSPVGRSLDTPMSGQIDVRYCNEHRSFRSDLPV